MDITEWERCCDDLGPAKIVHLYDPGCGMRAIVVVDNVACGPAIGGVRMAADVSAMEVYRLARAMTLKNASAGLPHGGGKAGILADSRSADRELLVRAFARAIRQLTDYIPGPDMGTDELCMAWVQDEIQRAVGLPRVLGGIPLDEIGATGFGLAEAAEVAAPHVKLRLPGARVAVEGFGNVGRHAARFLEQAGAVLVAASDTGGAVYDPEGIAVDDLVSAKQEGGSVVAYDPARQIAPREVFTVPCDVLIPAARPDSIDQENAGQIQAKLILQGANIPATLAAERLLWQRGVLVVPDFIANAGGVICASVEFHGGTQVDAFRLISERIRENTREVIRRSVDDEIPPRQAALQLAGRRVREAMRFQRCDARIRSLDPSPAEAVSAGS